ncbi:MAG: transposase [Alphaproteobacteria bacterium]
METEARKLNRLKRFNYSTNGAYYITICTKDKKKIFGDVITSPVGNGLDRSLIKLNQYGKIAESELLNIPKHFKEVVIDKYIIMPNHVHVIIIINKDDKIKERSRPFPTISTIVGLYKSGVSKKIGFSLWQRSFYDRVVRDECEYKNIWKYIDENPICWQDDEYFEMEEKDGN